MDKITRINAVKTWLMKDAKTFTTTDFMAFWKASTEEERQAFAETSARELGVELQTT